MMLLMASSRKPPRKRQINVPVSSECYEAVKLAAAQAFPGGMMMRYWVERALTEQANREIAAKVAS